ncbi:MAG: hypothetical protein JXB23_13355 [Candidatus Aminicenantes bacterium]|nr:hypothetical protein [Candidatus Aminicenantes bacterium]
MKIKIVRWNIYLGAALLAASVGLLASGNAFMQTWFYLFAWWPFILILDSVNYRWTGRSLFLKPQNEFVFMALVSVSVWLVFEVFNLRLRNWSYHSLPADLRVRWLGYFLAFASVIPALKVLARFFERLFQGRKLPFTGLKPKPGLLRASIGIGSGLLLISLIWPRLFFPCVWLGFIFLLEPLNHKLGIPSILRDMEAESGIRFWSWLSAGLASGFIWEFFNFWVGSHWEYSLPYFDFGRIFQMPVLGYFGFPPFALEVLAMYGLLSYVRRQWLRKGWARLLGVILLLVFDAGAFLLMDGFTWVR